MLKCSHILCKVDNIKAVVKDYESQGFSLVWGSTPEKAHNALLWFEEGPYIEFFQLPKKFEILKYPLQLFYGRSVGRRWEKWAKATEGWCDIALEPAEFKTGFSQHSQEYPLDIKTIKKALQVSGISSSRIVRKKRVSPEGEEVKFSVFCPDQEGFPFVFSGYKTSQRPLEIKHPNGAKKVAWVKVGVNPKDITQFKKLIKEDTFIKTEEHIQTHVCNVGLVGLQSNLDPKFLHGAVFTAL